MEETHTRYCSRACNCPGQSPKNIDCMLHSQRTAVGNCWRRHHRSQKLEVDWHWIGAVSDLKPRRSLPVARGSRATLLTVAAVGSRSQ